jgi:hypothetical protein
MIPWECFVPEEDGSIACTAETQIPLEFVSRKRVTFYVGEDDSRQTKSYQQMVADLGNLFSKSDPCAPGKCGMHVHMSLPDVHVNDHPFLFVFLQNEWIQRYQKKSIDEFGTRASSSYAQTQQEILGRDNLDKYRSLNLLPTFTEKVKGEEDQYRDRTEEDLVYHVEFRGQDDALVTYLKRSTRSGSFAAAAFTRYIRFLAEFMTGCANMPSGKIHLREADLSNLKLSRVSERFLEDIKRSNVSTLNLSKNNFDIRSLQMILDCVSQPESEITALNLNNIPNVTWDTLMLSLKTALQKLKICSRDRNRLKREIARLHPDCSECSCNFRTGYICSETRTGSTVRSTTTGKRNQTFVHGEPLHARIGGVFAPNR